MNTKLKRMLLVGGMFLVVILLFTAIDYFIHGLNDIWGVPDYYFKDKIPFGFLWGVVGLFLVRKFKIANLWLKALTVASVVAVTLQFRYFIEGYPLSFVLLFLLFHFIILYFLLLGMFTLLEKYAKN